MAAEGGFQGRTNKLVDSCYSFWVGGIFPLLDRVVFNPSKYDAEGVCLASDLTSTLDAADPRNEGGWMFDQRALQKYLLVCCQDSRGGLRDKPGKSADYYHTSYALSGLSIAEHNPEHWGGPSETLFSKRADVAHTDPVHNIGPLSVKTALEYFSNIPLQL